MALLAEPFLNSAALETTTGSLTFETNRPTKNPANPVYAGNNTSYDRHQVYVGGAVVDGRVHLWPGVWDDNWGLPSTGIAATYIYSDDGDTFTKPNLGLVSYGGNTNNNILLGGGPVNVAPNICMAASGASYEPDNDYPYLIHGTHWTTNLASGTHRIYGATEPDGPLTLIQNLGAWSQTLERSGGGSNVMRDMWSLTRRADDRWLITYQETSAVERRSVGVLLSNETTLNSGTTWVNHGVPTGLQATAIEDQYYSGTAWRDGDALLMVTCMFDGNDYYVYPYGTFSGTKDRQWKFELWTSRADDGLTWTKLDEDWMWSGSGINDNTPGEWDAGAIKPGALVRMDDEDRYYYCGSSEVHHPLAGRDNFVDQHRIGYATLRRNGIGGLTGTGTARTGLVTAAQAAALTINSVGTVEVELLDASNNVITGYAAADCDTIPADTTDHTVTWNGTSVTPDEFKVKLYLTSATVHYLTAEEAEAEFGLTLDESGIWTQDGYNLTVTGASANTRHSTTATVVSRNGGTVNFTGADAAAFYVSSDGSTWASSLAVPAGSTDIHVSVLATPEPNMASLSATMLIPV